MDAMRKTARRRCAVGRGRPQPFSNVEGGGEAARHKWMEMGKAGITVLYAAGGPRASQALQVITMLYREIIPATTLITIFVY